MFLNLGKNNSTLSINAVSFKSFSSFLFFLECLTFLNTVWSASLLTSKPFSTKFCLVSALAIFLRFLAVKADIPPPRVPPKADAISTSLSPIVGLLAAIGEYKEPSIAP